MIDRIAGSAAGHFHPIIEIVPIFVQIFGPHAQSRVLDERAELRVTLCVFVCEESRTRSIPSWIAASQPSGTMMSVIATRPPGL